MTNLETAPTEVLCDDAGRSGAVQVLTPRDVPLGGIRAMTVRRTLPQRARSFIGAWCFLDHYGPDDVAVSGGMQVPPHPHTGLQTVSWLFSGEVEHRDSLGTHAFVRPGELNLMTAGRGISHSEDSTEATRVLHGVQLWTVLPEKDREAEPAFDHHVPPVVLLEDGAVRVFLGELEGSRSPVPTFSPLLGAEVVLAAGTEHTFRVEPTFEHGVLVDTGSVELLGTAGATGELLYVAPGASTLTIRSGADGDLRVLLLGGLPLGEQIVMWWNFIGRDHAEVARARHAWQVQIGAEAAEDGGAGAEPQGSGTAPRFGTVVGHPHPPLPAPPIPPGGLKPRG